ncbi:MAG: bifunctional riboflavin kinase/FAD synthetase [Candidatus Cloacimonetes bacterium]|nr:bifunctional riboflavin kinase/FAD synthetase [Candidatus Cloacimonadota bacterium]
MTKPVITIGTFDGVHKGHQYLLAETVKEARLCKAKSIVITYPIHPLEIIHNKIFPYLLTEPEKREYLIKKIGIDEVYYLNFDKILSQMTAENFLKDILIKQFKPQTILTGYDTHFGINRTGNTEFLKQRAFFYNYKIKEVLPLYVNDIIPGSSLIRDLISSGLVSSAFKYLGHYFSIIGTVVSGKKIGRTLGFPTINLQPIEVNKLIPANGVYFTCSKIDNKLYYGATNIGVSPSIKTENKVEIETFLLNFSANVYNQKVELFFIEKIRDEKKFNNQQELINQIFMDIESIKSKIIHFHEWNTLKES